MAMAGVCLGLLAFGTLGTRLTHVEVSGSGGLVAAVAVMFATLLPLPAYWQQMREIDRRNAALVLYWTILFVVLLPYPVIVAARMQMPLRDSLMAAVDARLHVSVPALMAWAHRHVGLEASLKISYACLTPMLLVAIVLPACMGRRQAAERFLLSNAAAFFLAIPLFGALPVIGPWVSYGFAPSGAQQQCMDALMGLRVDGLYLFRAGTDLGIISFPSFHVIWALLSARVLWEFRWLRVPALVLAGMICLSTMTTGWHYFADVLGGVAIAVASDIGAGLLLGRDPARG
jgi:hypothetical protein